jgi:hypothetical protein
MDDPRRFGPSTRSRPVLPVTNIERSPFPDHETPHLGALITLIKGVRASSRKVHLHSSGVSFTTPFVFCFISISHQAVDGSTDWWRTSNGGPAGVIWGSIFYISGKCGIKEWLRHRMEPHQFKEAWHPGWGKRVYGINTRDNCSPFLHTLLKLLFIHHSPQPR